MTDKTIRITTGDVSVASIVGAVDGQLDLTLLAGDVEVEVDVNGLVDGITTLFVTQVEDSLTNSVGVRVQGPYVLPDGTYSAASLPLGIRLLAAPTGSEAVAFSSVVGARVNAPAVAAGESIFSKPIGVVLLSE